MPKILPPNTIEIDGAKQPFITNAMPDVFDERDLLYRARLEPLPAVVDQRTLPTKKAILKQTGESCTGHAVATVINTALAHRPVSEASKSNGARRKLAHVSPYMLYYLGRRYDEFAGESDIGSSLRGVFKGWFHHGVCLDDIWPKLDLVPQNDLDDPQFIEQCRDRPLGAFYRINPYNLDDMQSAINELHAVAVSSAIHDGWMKPIEMTRTVEDGSIETMFVIRRNVDSQPLGGHAYALVGYNEVGFLVQNSWGETWGKKGFATLPYEEWLDSAYDAWVARPGVPKTPFASGRTRSATATGFALATVPGLDTKRLAVHVVNLGNDGKLSNNGKFTSKPSQIDGIFERMEQWHDAWVSSNITTKRQIVLFAHGGLTSESAGLANAQKQLNWWLNNAVYPVYFAWESGAVETLIDQLLDMNKARIPVGALGFDLQEQFDRLIELLARKGFRWTWEQMKQNARAASEPLGKAKVSWPPSSNEAAMAQLPGASLTVSRLAAYVKKHGANNVAIHLVGHSAGSIFHAGMLQRLIEAGINIESMALLAPAIRVDEFQRDILPHLGKQIQRFAIFNLNDQRENDDICGTGPVHYNKSLLFLVSRALEQTPASNVFEVPLLGMQRFFKQPLDAGQPTLEAAISTVNGAMIFSPADAPDNSRSNAKSHGGFSADETTMTSVVERMLGTTAAWNTYKEDANLRFVEPTSSAVLGAAMVLGDSDTSTSFTPPADTNAPGDVPLSETGTPQSRLPKAPESDRGLEPEVAVAPRSGSPVIDVLEYVGWQVADSEATSSSSAKTNGKAKSGRTKAK